MGNTYIIKASTVSELFVIAMNLRAQGKVKEICNATFSKANGATATVIE